MTGCAPARSTSSTASGVHHNGATAAPAHLLARFAVFRARAEEADQVARGRAAAKAAASAQAKQRKIAAMDAKIDELLAAEPAWGHRARVSRDLRELMEPLHRAPSKRPQRRPRISSRSSSLS